MLLVGISMTLGQDDTRHMIVAELAQRDALLPLAPLTVACDVIHSRGHGQMSYYCFLFCSVSILFVEIF